MCVTLQFDCNIFMTDSHRPSSQDEPYPDEDLLEGLQKLAPAFYQQIQASSESEDNVSMLLDSINAFTRNSQAVVEAIQQTIEEDQDLTPLHITERALITVDNQTSVDPPIGLAHEEINNENQIPCSPAPKSPLFEQQRNAFEGKEISLENQQPIPLLPFSHYNSKQQDSFGKIEQNSSLFVEYSNQKSMDFSVQEPLNNCVLQQDVSSLLNHEEKPIINDPQVSANQQFVEQVLQETFKNQNEETREMVIEEQRHIEECSNYSMDSSKLAAMIPLESVQSQRNVINEPIEQVENQYQRSPVEAKKFEQPIQFIHIETIQANQINFPMKEEQTYLPVDIPMNFQHGNFPFSLNQNEGLHNPIIIDSIYQQKVQQPEEQQRAEQQEMLDSMNGFHHEISNQQVDPYQEFTFGKEEAKNEYYDRQKEEEMKSPRNAMSQCQPINHFVNQQLGNSIEIPPLQNQIFWNSLREENAQNLSMNVEHDNNFTAALKDIEEILVDHPVMESCHEIANNFQPVLVNLQIQQSCVQEQPKKSSQLQPNCFISENVYQNSENIFFSGNCQEKISKMVEEQAHQNNFIEIQRASEKSFEVFDEPKNKQYSIPEDRSFHQPQLIVAIDESQHELKTNQPCSIPNTSLESVQEDHIPSETVNLKSNLKKCAINNVCNMSLNNDHSLFNTIKSPDKYPVNQYTEVQNCHSCHHFNNFSHPSYHNQAQNHHTNQLEPQPIYQSNVQVQPWMTINYKIDGASINLFGPMIQTKQENTLINNACLNPNPQEANKKSEEEIEPQLIIAASEGKSKIEKINEDATVQDSQPINIQKDEKKVIQQKFPQKELVDSSIQTIETACKISSQVESTEDVRERCKFIIAQSENYLLSFDLTAEHSHKDFEKLVGVYVVLRFTPEPKNEIGVKLFKNGLFLIAIVKLITRSSPTPFLFSYMYEYLDNTFGLLLERNSFVFKSQCQKAKKNYEVFLEKKYNEAIFSRVEQKYQEKIETVKRSSISHNPFISIQCQKRDSGLQVQVQKESINKSGIKKQHENEERNKKIETVILIEPENTERSISHEISKPNNVSNSSNKEKLKKPDIFESPQNLQVSIKIQKEPKMIETIQQTSIKKDKNTDNQIKKNIEEIKNSFGSYAKKCQTTPESSNDQNSRFRQLYEKYRRIREDKEDKSQNKGELPIDNSSIKRNLVTQILKTEEKELEVDKKLSKKQVAFPEDVVKKDICDNQDDDDGDFAKKKKKKKNKSKKDSADNSSELEDNGTYNKTRKSWHSKKDK